MTSSSKSFLERFNDNSSLLHLPLKKATDLNEEKPYQLINMKVIATKFGDAAVAICRDDNGEKFKIFLPKRFVGIVAEFKEEVNNLKGFTFGLVFSNIKSQSPDVKIIEMKV